MIDKCDYCGRENATDAVQCIGCGSAIAKRSESAPKAKSEFEDLTRSAAEKSMLYGALWCMGGIAVTATTYLAASGRGGGKYVIAWGAILFGAIQFFRGLSGRTDQYDPEEAGYEALEVATRLETEGRVQEAIAVYESIAQNYPDKPVGHDAQKSLDHLRAKVG
jgi:hypothetical protein